MKILKTGLLALLPAMLLFSCSKDPIPAGSQDKSEKQFPATGFSKIQVADKFQINIKQGSSFLIKATGTAADLNDMEVATDAGNQLHISYKPTNRVHNEIIKIDIILPLLQVLDAGGLSKATITGFEQQASFMQMKLSEAAEAIVNGTPDELTFFIIGTSRLQASGTTSGLYGHLREASTLEAYGLNSVAAEVEASGTATARLTGTQRLRLEAADASVIRYKGDPPSIRTETSGTARIIKE